MVAKKIISAIAQLLGVAAFMVMLVAMCAVDSTDKAYAVILGAAAVLLLMMPIIKATEEIDEW